MSNSDTIFALSSAVGKAGVCVIRVSGPQTWRSLEILSAGVKPPEPRQTKVIALKNPETKDIIDEAMVIGFQAPASFTGEDVIEYHCHGSPAILDEMLAMLGTDGRAPPGKSW